MKKLLGAAAALPFLASVAFAGQPLTDRQMDTVTAGFILEIRDETNFSATIVTVNTPPMGCKGCYLDATAGFVQVFAFIGRP